MSISLLILLTLLIAVPTVLASVTNDVNIKSSGGSSKTNVEIHQTGEGTSKVTINGKEWKLEGPGNISVSETSSPNPTSSPTQSPTSSPQASPYSPEADTQTKGLVNQIIKILEQAIERLKDLF